MPPPPPLKTFIIYSSLDRDLRDELERHLLPLVDLGWLEVWSDKAILPGEVSDKAIKKELLQADIFLLLVSVDFYNSCYIREEEFKTAVARLESGDSLVIPIIVRPCTWKFYPVIKDLQVLPSGGKAVTDTDHWKSRDKAWDNVVEMIGDRLERLREEQVEAKNRTTEEAHNRREQAEAEKKRLVEETKRQKREQAEAERRRLDPFHDLMVLVKGGTFDMGSTEDDDAKPIHKVILSDFWLCKYPVTQGLWKAVMGKDNNPSYFTGDDNLPVEMVSWEDAQAFIKTLNSKTGSSYRLPSEAEWEYAAREGGKNIRFGNGKDIADPKEINFNGSKVDKTSYSTEGEYRQKTTLVGQFQPNALGFYDMSGNVYEWCEGYCDSYVSDNQINTADSTSGFDRVLRGGSWDSRPMYVRATNRISCTPDCLLNYVGFRVAKSVSS